MPAGRRHAARSGAPPVNLNPRVVEDSKTAKPPVPGTPPSSTCQVPKHVAMPDIPRDSDLWFELILFSYSVVALFLQNLNLYKTVWWLPYSYAKRAINVDLIDFQLVGFILILLSRRFLWCLLKSFIMRYSPSKLRKPFFQLSRVFVMVIVLGGMSFCVYKIFISYQIVKLLYLCYPLSIYFILFGMRLSPFLDLIPEPPVMKDREEKQETRSGKGRGGSSNTNAKRAVGLQHFCSTNADTVREEVELLRNDANQRIKHVLFNSLLNSYYAGFIPCCFVQPHLIYDQNWCIITLVFVYISCMVAYLAHCFPPAYTDVMHQAALHLGQWNRIESNRTHLPYTNWQDCYIWQKGVLVKHTRELFKAEGLTNAAEPGNSRHARFFMFFSNPAILLGVLLGLQACMVGSQLFLLLRSYEWYKVLSSCLLLFQNNYFLFKLGRDYYVMGKVYGAEDRMQKERTPT